MILLDILGNKCPNCRKGNVYDENHIAFNFNKPRMNTSCSNCNFKYHKEPGFYWGAMYVSYILTVAESVIVFFLSSFLFDTMFDLRKIAVIAICILILSPFNMRLSRLLWLYLFTNSKQ